jgi:hypothetical protein
MEITFAPRGILRTLWMKAFFHEVRPETVDNQKREKSAAPHRILALPCSRFRIVFPSFVRSDVKYELSLPWTISSPKTSL